MLVELPVPTEHRLQESTSRIGSGLVAAQTYPAWPVEYVRGAVDVNAAAALTQDGHHWSYVL